MHLERCRSVFILHTRLNGTKTNNIVLLKIYFEMVETTLLHVLRQLMINLTISLQNSNCFLIKGEECGDFVENVHLCNQKS